MTIISGMMDRIGGLARLRLEHGYMSDSELQQDIGNHDQAVRWTLDRCKRSEVEAVGHRVVHGVAIFQEPVRIDGTVMVEIEQLSKPTPRHNPACLVEITADRAVLSHEMPMVAVFDTAFHRTMPERASTYAIPQDLPPSIARGAMGSMGSPMRRSIVHDRVRRGNPMRENRLSSPCQVIL